MEKDCGAFAGWRAGFVGGGQSVGRSREGLCGFFGGVVRSKKKRYRKLEKGKFGKEVVDGGVGWIQG